MLNWPMDGPGRDGLEAARVHGQGRPDEMDQSFRKKFEAGMDCSRAAGSRAAMETAGRGLRHDACRLRDEAQKVGVDGCSLCQRARSSPMGILEMRCISSVLNRSGSAR